MSEPFKRRMGRMESKCDRFQSCADRVPDLLRMRMPKLWP